MPMISWSCWLIYLAQVSNSCFLHIPTAKTSLILHLMCVPVVFTYKSLGTESMVTAPNLWFHDATMIESAKLFHACPFHPYQRIMIFTFPMASFFISVPRLSLTMVTAHFPIWSPMTCAHLMIYFPKNHTTTMQNTTTKILNRFPLLLVGAIMSLYESYFCISPIFLLEMVFLPNMFFDKQSKWRFGL